MNDHTLNDATIDEILRSVNYMIQEAINNTTKIYKGIVVSNNNDGKWNIQYNGKIHPTISYRSSNPSIGQIVMVFIPQGNESVAFFI